MRMGSRQRQASDHPFGLDPPSFTPPVVLVSTSRGVHRPGGGMEGAAVWKMILRAIKELHDTTPPGDQSAVH